MLGTSIHMYIESIVFYKDAFVFFSYFDDNDDNNLEYQPAPGSPGQQEGKQEDSEGEDPLDAFMAEIEVVNFT